MGTCVWEAERLDAETLSLTFFPPSLLAANVYTYFIKDWGYGSYGGVAVASLFNKVGLGEAGEVWGPQEIVLWLRQ